MRSCLFRPDQERWWPTKQNLRTSCLDSREYRRVRSPCTNYLYTSRPEARPQQRTTILVRMHRRSYLSWIEFCGTRGASDLEVDDMPLRYPGCRGILTWAGPGRRLCTNKNDCDAGFGVVFIAFSTGKSLLIPILSLGRALVESSSCRRINCGFQCRVCYMSTRVRPWQGGVVAEGQESKPARHGLRLICLSPMRPRQAPRGDHIYVSCYGCRYILGPASRGSPVSPAQCYKSTLFFSC